MFQWLNDTRRRAADHPPFPAEWRDILSKMVKHYSYLNPNEQNQLERLVQVFADEKEFEGCNGLVITDEIRVVISAEACLLILGLPHNLYRKLSTILVYPSTVFTPPERRGAFTVSPMLEQAQVPISGQAFMHGPIILVWDAVRRGARHPESGHNVVYHEFAHLLDMLDGAADGVPPLHERDQYRAWASVFSDEFQKLRKATDHGTQSFLDPYGATNEAEFFAVATEFFFDQPIEMQQNHQPLYDVLSGYYMQDTAERAKRNR